jgi:hypothetical protein
VNTTSTTNAALEAAKLTLRALQAEAEAHSATIDTARLLVALAGREAAGGLLSDIEEYDGDMTLLDITVQAEELVARMEATS